MQVHMHTDTMIPYNICSQPVTENNSIVWPYPISLALAGDWTCDMQLYDYIGTQHLHSANSSTNLPSMIQDTKY